MRKTELMTIFKNSDLNYSSMVLDFIEKEKFKFFWAILKFLNIATVLQVLPHSLYQTTLLQQMRD